MEFDLESSDGVSASLSRMWKANPYQLVGLRHSVEYPWNMIVRVPIMVNKAEGDFDQKISGGRYPKLVIDNLELAPLLYQSFHR